MVSLWSSSKNSDEQNGSGTPARRGGESHSSARRQDYHSEDPDETTRLLPRPPPSDGYLDPDDPAVSPYNLWSVRLLRYVTVLFLVTTLLWWTLLLVTIFVSPPRMHSRGSGFFDFSYTTLTAGTLLVALLFFSNPSKAMRVSLGIIAGLLLIDVVIIAAVARIRSEEGWVGIASIIWAFLMAFWCLLTDRVVAWGKREEEERLTGRPETRRTVKEWFGVLISTTLLVMFAVITLLITATLCIRASDASLHMEGKRYPVDGGKYEVHLACMGNTTHSHGKRAPAVILEAGEEPSEYDFEHWIFKSWKNGTISRYCYWDRPGYAWSDNAPSPHSAGMSADALSEALARAGEEGPWILVSAGTGSIVSRIFASRHAREVTGIMMIDPLHEDLLHRIGSPGRGFLLWGWGIISPLGIQRIGGALFKSRTREDRVYGQSAYQGGKFIKAQLQENLVAESLTKNEVSSSRTIQNKDTPVVIISSGIKCRTDREWERKQRDLTHLTDKLVSWDVVNKAPHQVWQTLDGRLIMENRLGALVKEASKFVYQGP